MPEREIKPPQWGPTTDPGPDSSTSIHNFWGLSQFAHFWGVHGDPPYMRQHFNDLTLEQSIALEKARLAAVQEAFLAEIKAYSAFLDKTPGIVATGAKRSK